MTSFQLDQCLDSKRFVRDCAAEGRCRVLRLPADLRDAKDPDLLHEVDWSNSVVEVTTIGVEV